MQFYKHIVLSTVFFASCTPHYDEKQRPLLDYRIEEGFDLEIVAAEPLIQSPVAMDFDDKGRMWVVEMPGFMATLDGKDENSPTGKIKILEDRDEDGISDHLKIFLDSLIMPRAIALIYGGVLYAEPPNLWFVDIVNDKPEKRVLVDSLYAPDGNPEYQANGLVMNIDNWIYSANSNFRYRRDAGEWLKTPTTVRGQWGIAHDNFGRLYYNNNYQQLLGDYLLPNRLIRNKFYTPKYGTNRILTSDQKIYPLHSTAVNRGYVSGVLNNDSILREVTAANSPLVYRGGAFPKEYNGNVFVCLPEGNVVKRNVLEFHGDSTSAFQKWQGKEFLSSYDEGFRPVGLLNAPDGSLNIIDMHTGVIQHYAFLSPYLKNRIKKEKLDTIKGYGRILKIKNETNKHKNIPDFHNLSVNEIVELLKSENGWVRDKAQQILIDEGNKSVVPNLNELALNINYPISQIHALYVLEGLHELSFGILKKLIRECKTGVSAHAIVLLENFLHQNYVNDVKNLFKKILEEELIQLELYMATTIGAWMAISSEDFKPIFHTLLERYGDNPIFMEALVSGFDENFMDLTLLITQDESDDTNYLHKFVAQIEENRDKDDMNSIFNPIINILDDRTNGAKIFRQICASCHGINGKGIEGLAPPFVGSEYLSGSVEKLGLIILHGLQGPVHVDGKTYNFKQGMPGMRGNKSLSDEDISDIISYITNAFSDSSRKIEPNLIQNLREVRPMNGEEFTEKELMEL